MNRLPVWRIALLRLGYLTIAVMLGIFVVPELFAPKPDARFHEIAVLCFLGSLAALCLVGAFRPLRMLPVLLFELGWKLIMMLGVALPAWLAGRVTLPMEDLFWQCLPILLYVPLIPWRHVRQRFLPRRSGDEQAGPATH